MTFKRRPYTSFPANEAGLVDKFLGTAYDVVREVYENLEHIIKVSTEIDNLPSSAKEIFEESVGLYMPKAYDLIDEHTLSKLPEIDSYIDSGKKDILNYTEGQKDTINKMVEDSSQSLEENFNSKIEIIKENVDKSKDYSDLSKKYAEDSYNFSRDSERFKDETKDNLEDVINNREEVKELKKLTDLNKNETIKYAELAEKSKNTAEIHKDTAMSASISAKYSQEEAFRSETESKNTLSEIKQDKLIIDELSQKVREDRITVNRLTEESRDLEKLSKDHEKEAEYWAKKAKENAGVDTSGFIGMSHIVGELGDNEERLIHQKATTQFLSEKRDLKDNDFEEILIGKERIVKGDKGNLVFITEEGNYLELPKECEGTLAVREVLDEKIEILNNELNKKQNTLEFIGKGKTLNEGSVATNLEEDKLLISKDLVDHKFRYIEDNYINNVKISQNLGDSESKIVSQKVVSQNIDDIRDNIENNYYQKSETLNKEEIENSINSYHDNSKIDKKDITNTFGNSSSKVTSQVLVTGLNNQIQNFNTELYSKRDLSNLNIDINNEGTHLAFIGTSKENKIGYSKSSQSIEIISNGKTFTLKGEEGDLLTNSMTQGSGNIARMSEVNKKRDKTDDSFSRNIKITYNDHESRLETSINNYARIVSGGKNFNFNGSSGGTVATTDDSDRAYNRADDARTRAINAQSRADNAYNLANTTTPINKGGTGATTASKARENLGALGKGENFGGVYKDETENRMSGVYYKSGDKSRFVIITVNSKGRSSFQFNVGGVLITDSAATLTDYSSGNDLTFSVIIPPNTQYRFTSYADRSEIVKWMELE